MRLSIIICTRNRAAGLKETLEAAIASIALAPDTELLVVDNGSSDDTRTVVSELVGIHSCLRYHFVEEPGLSNARNAGLALAEGDIIAFLDDDAIPEPGWASGILDTFSDPEIVAVGGRAVLEWSEAKPEWFPSEFECYFAPYDLGGKICEVTDEHYPVGANMAFRRFVFDKLGGFDTRLGYSGEAKFGWEDIEMFYRISQIGGKIVYQPSALVHHKVGAEKVTRSYIKKRLFAEGYGYVYYKYIREHPSKKQISADMHCQLRKIGEVFLFHTKWFAKHGSLEYKYKMDTLREWGKLCALTHWWKNSCNCSELKWSTKTNASCCRLIPTLDGGHEKGL